MDESCLPMPLPEKSFNREAYNTVLPGSRFLIRNK
jgi:hypothetical protein